MKTHDRALVSITGATALVGILAAIAVTASLPSGQRDFITISGPVQLLISVGVPFLGVLMTVDLHRSRRPFLPTLLRALGAALAFACFGAVATAVAVAAFPSDASEGRWSDAGVVLLGSVLVQVVAQLTGTGLGLLIRRPVVACLATIVLPLGLWLLLGAVAPAARAWLTPFDSASRLLAGAMTAASWPAFVVVASLWGLSLNLIGYRLLRLADPSGSVPAVAHGSPDSGVS
jgi:hypothetical protein